MWLSLCSLSGEGTRYAPLRELVWAHFRELQLVDSRELQSDLNGGENEMRQRAGGVTSGRVELNIGCDSGMEKVDTW